VLIEEPPADARFLFLPNLMVAPHIGGNSEEEVETMCRSTIDRWATF